MQEVIILQGSDSEGTWIEDVFSAETKAQQAKEKLQEFNFNTPNIYFLVKWEVK